MHFLGDFDGFLPFTAPKLPELSDKKKVFIAVVALVLLAALWWDFLAPHGIACETDANCTPKNASEARVGVRYACVNKTCVEKPFGNPASEKCVEDGGTLRMQENENGTSGICVLPNGTECDEWAYFRGECGGATPS